LGDSVAINDAIMQEFDMPLWASHSGIPVPVRDLNNTFVYQLKACNLHCPWCYVDDNNKDGREEGGAFFSVEDMLNLFIEEQKRRRPLGDPVYSIRPSGGEMTLDGGRHWLDLLKLVQSRGVTAYVQGDTNLTTGRYMEVLETQDLNEGHTLEKIGEYRNFGLLCSFKGTDRMSFSRASGMPGSYAFLEEERWRTFAKFVKAGIDCYPFIYDPDPSSIWQFMETGEEMFGQGFVLKTWVFPLKLYAPERQRLQGQGIDPDEYQRALDRRFREAEEVMQDFVHAATGKSYKDVPRPGIVLKAKTQS
jgi:uncharacterized Fe-S cluster-containing radical SAM superfamily protein